MCGLSGIYQLKRSNVDSKTIIEKMNRQIAHRGPDAEGYFIDEKIALGHRRLSILDLSSLGHQPMFSSDKKYVIVFNGEVYNYLELKTELQSEGYKFKSGSDTEVILAAYDFWKEECVSKFNGMWALAIYDRQKKRLFCSRDRLGVKPFYYLLNRENFVFASEIKAILEFPRYRKKPNPQAVYDFLFHAFSDHEEDTFFAGIKQLMPGHSLIIANNKIKIIKYWDLGEQKEKRLTEKEAVEKFRYLFEDATSLRLRSDVPIGTCLSGGLDSSSIVGQINQLMRADPSIKSSVGKMQKTFSCIYSDPAYKAFTEKKYIDQVVTKTKVQPYFTDVKHTNLLKEIEDITYHQDEPSSASSVYAQWLLYRQVKQKKVKVMLDGQGSDEMLGGYVGVAGIYLMDILRTFNFFALSKELSFFRKLHPEVSGISLARILSFPLLNRLPETLFNQAYQFAFQSNYGFMDKNFARKNFRPFKMPRRFDNFFKDFNYWQMNAISLPAILRSEDRNSMAFAVEARVPFLDYRLVEFIFSLPNDLIIKNGQTKYILRQALKDLLPASVLSRHDKIGFDTPEKIWMQKHLRREVEQIIHSDAFKSRPYFDWQKLREQYEAMMTNQKPFDHSIWRAISLEMWLRVFMD